MLGSEKVGKSSLVSQFMTSEYLHAYDTSIGEFGILVNSTLFRSVYMYVLFYAHLHKQHGAEYFNETLQN